MKGRIYPTYRRDGQGFVLDESGRKIQDGWQVRFGAKIGRHFTLNNLIGAQRYLNFLRYQVDEGVFDPRDHKVKQNPLGLKKLGDKWLSLKKKKIRPRSYANLARYMGYVYDYFGKKTNVKLIQYGGIEDFLYSLKLSDKTRANIKSCLHDFFSWIQKRERIPAPDMPAISYELEFRNVIDLDTQRTIINTVKEISTFNPKIFFAIRSLATYLSIRPGELISLKERQVDAKMGALVFPHPKEKRPKIIYLMDSDLDFIKSQPRGLPDMYFFRHPPGLKGVKAGQRFGPRYLYKWWKKACNELGIEGVEPAFYYLTN